MQTSNIRRIFVIAGIVSLSVSYLGIWIRLISDPFERTGSDFIAFYGAGRVAQDEGTAKAYDLNLQQDIQEKEVGFPLVSGQVLLYNHLPFLIPILQFVVTTDYVNSFYRWIFLLIALSVTAIIFLSRVLKDMGFDQNTILLTGVCGFLFLPLFFSLIIGQDTAFLFLGSAIWMYGLVSGKETLAGLGLSLTTVRPHIALILAIPMLPRHRNVFLGFVLGSGALGLFSFLILGKDGTREFINIIRLSAGGEWYGMKEFAMYNLIGLLTRTIPWLGSETIRAIGWVLYGITITGLYIFWARNRDLRNGQIGLTMTLALIAVPHLHFHDLALLLIPIYDLICLSTQTRILGTSSAPVLPVAISLLLLISNASPFLQYTIPYLIMLLLAGHLYHSKHKLSATSPRQSSLPER